MIVDYIKQPRSLNQLSDELKRLCDDYWDGKIKEDVVMDYIKHVSIYTNMLTEDGSLNTTVAKLIAKKRQALVLTFLKLISEGA